MLIAFVIQAIFAALIYEEKTNPNNIKGTDEIVRDNIYVMLFVENIAITIMALYFFIFFRNSNPPTPPSFAAMRNHSSITQGMAADFMTLMRNRNFVLVTLSYVLIFSIYSGLSVILPLLWLPFGFGPFDVSVFGAIFVFVGAFACYFAGKYLDRTNKYLLSLRFVLTSTFALFLFSIYLIPTGKFYC